MFKINYHIYKKDKKEMKLVKQYELKNNNIYGQFQIQFDYLEIGFYNVDYEDIPIFSEDEKKSFLETLPTEIINLWFANFLDAIKELKKEKISKIPFIESLDYIFLKREEDLIFVTFSNCKEIFKIDFNDFIQEILYKANLFVEELRRINPALLKMENIVILDKKIVEFTTEYRSFYNEWYSKSWAIIKNSLEKAQEITKDEEKHLNADLHTDLANEDERGKIALAGRKVKTVVEALTEDKGTTKQNVIKAGLRAINIDELRKDKQKEFNLVDDKETAPLDKLIVLRDLQAELYKREGYTGELPELLLTDEPNSFVHNGKIFISINDLNNGNASALLYAFE